MSCRLFVYFVLLARNAQFSMAAFFPSLFVMLPFGFRGSFQSCFPPALLFSSKETKKMKKKHIKNNMEKLHFCVIGSNCWFGIH